jgi:hypothetical protein
MTALYKRKRTEVGFVKYPIIWNVAGEGKDSKMYRTL